MQLLKRSVCILLSVMILFFSVSNSYFSPVKLDKVHAAETIILSEEIARLICEYFGAMTYGYASADKAKPNITTDDLAKLGHEFIKGLYDVNGIPPEVADVQKELIENKQALGMLSYLGQSYVFGSEALQEVAGMDFSVIQGGGDDEDPDEESKFKKFAKSAFCLTMSGALAISQVLPLVATELMNENPTEYEQNNPEYKFTGYEDSYIPDAQQYNIQAYSYSTATASYTGLEDVHIYTFQSMTSTRVHVVYSENFGYKFCKDNGDPININFSSKYHHKNLGWKTWNSSTYLMSYVLPDHTCTFSANIPVYSSDEAWKEALASGDFTGALNYNRVYPIADWLKEDWSGVLYDPLTGLNTGADWFTLVRQGLASASSVGEDINEETYRNGLRDYFKDARENRDEANAPYIDPALAPIYLPATMPEVKIDPDANIAVSPATNPNPEPDPDPEPSATATPTPGTGGLPYTKPVVDLSKFFPFCVPFDLIHLVQVLDAEPVAPRWEVKLEPPLFPVEWEIVIDMADFEVLAKIFRTGETLLFVVGLILITRGIIKG